MSSSFIENRLDRIEKSLAHKADKADIETIKSDIERLEGRIEKIEQRLDRMVEIMDRIMNELTIIRTEQKAISATLLFHEERIGRPEDKVFGQRVREDGEEYGKDV